jgi:hypothetical protein
MTGIGMLVCARFCCCCVCAESCFCPSPIASSSSHGKSAAPPPPPTRLVPGGGVNLGTTVCASAPPPPALQGSKSDRDVVIRHRVRVLTEEEEGSFFCIFQNIFGAPAALRGWSACLECWHETKGFVLNSCALALGSREACANCPAAVDDVSKSSSLL